MGIYLPGINAILDGLIPFRDFFYLRGPLEMYVPAALMHFLGESVWVLTIYFYLGTVLTLILCVFLARELYQTRFVLYLMIPVLIGRTFPRVVFTYWGGMRYALGILVLLCVVYFLKRKRLYWMTLAGIASALATLTSVEVGVVAVSSVLILFFSAAFLKIFEKQRIGQAALYYVAGLATVVIPYTIYLLTTHSFGSYVDATYSVVTSMTKVFPDYFLEDHPKNWIEILAALNPLNVHFKHLTPAYCYLFLLIYFIYRWRSKKWQVSDSCAVAVGGYGLVMYLTAFRKIGAAQFEMALQPEKILLFFMLEAVYLFLMERKNTLLKSRTIDRPSRMRWSQFAQIYGIYFLIFSFFMSSVCYAIARYNNRFFAFRYIKNLTLGQDTRKLLPLAGEECELFALPRVRGLVVPASQARDIRQLTEFIRAHTKANEPVFMFPELGAYSFIVDRPSVGRFPMATFAWINDAWQAELMKDLREVKPRFAVLSKDPGETFEKAYFRIPSNKKNFDDVMSYLHAHYAVTSSTPSLWIYERRSGLN